ncbi:MAG: class I SAM-dependent methyltransferase [Sulfurovum sp.]|nr:class I SAM-dependent methyltransferase [Sulfurovum sp.]NNJ45156.1 class I SAM-dependent methyltransferase [Sulfurovum sp.]
MSDKVSEGVWGILVCPDCKSRLIQSGEGGVCDVCKTNYANTRTGGIDCRLKNPVVYESSITIGNALDVNCKIGQLIVNDKPEVDFSGIDVPFHLTKETMSYLPKAKSESSLMLDLGCGGQVHKKVCEHAGFEYVGLDYGLHAPVCGDAHALPFCDESFEFIMSIAVLEHLRYPFVAMEEACRVLKPNGLFIGTVAFLEPFHAESFYHHTHLGVINSLQQGGFKVEKISPSDEWSVLKAQAEMALFPGVPNYLVNIFILPVQLLHKVAWRLFKGKEAEIERIRDTTGAFTFIARKMS